MKQFFTLLCLCTTIGLFSQINFSANDQVTPYNGLFRPGVNPAFYPNWTSEQVADVAAGNSLFGIPGVGVKTMRTAMSDDFVTQFGYDYLLPTYDYYGDLGLTDLTVIVGFPHPSHQETTEYCPGIQSEMFAGLYEDIWDGGANGTPYNDNNLFAAYMYEITTRYTPYVKFWEIWNEPGFDFSGNCGWREPGDPVCNWWDQNPEPCDNKLRAPMESYIRTLRIAYEVIKTVSPDDYVVIAGVGFDSFLDAILRNTDNPNGGSVATADYPLTGGAYFDVMGFHSYPHFDGTTIYYDNNIQGLAYERHSDRAAFGIPFKQASRQSVLDNYGYDGNTYPKKESIITEINIPRDPVGGQWIGSEDAQKNYIIKAVVNAIKYDVRQIHVFRLGEREYFATADNGQTGNPEFNLMGLYQRMDDIQPYQQIINIEGIAYKTASDCLFGTTFDQAKTNQMNLPAGVDGGAFLQSNGEYVYVIWAKTTIDLSEQASATYSFPGTFGFDLVYKKNWDFSQTSASTPINSNNINLDATPIFLTEGEFVPPASITLLCPDDLTVFAAQNANGAVVNYNQPNVSTTCSSGLNISLTGGLSSGSIFPIGTSVVEYEATDDCGNVVICSFNVTVQAPLGGCPNEISGFSFLGEYEGHKYFISDAVGRPAAGQIAAQTVGGHLAVINSAGENAFIQQNISDLVYIGLNDAGTEGQLEWVNNESVTYTNYDICNFCSENTDDDDYVVMHPWNGGWSFSNQFNQRLYVIEFACDGGGDCTDTTINPCDDGNPCTVEDFETVSNADGSVCIPCTGILLSCATGATTTIACDDGDPSTINDTQVILDCDGSICIPCGGIPVDCNTGSTSVVVCDDGDANTINDVQTILDADGTICVPCAGTPVIGGGCPDDISGFTAIGEFGGHKYYISNAVSRPTDAQATATANDGYLIAINSQEENDFIQQNVNDLIYIGLNDQDVEGDLVWYNGDPVTYNNVNPCGFCEENSAEMDYAILQPWDGGWSFSNFWNQRLYVMEVDCDGGGGNGTLTIDCPTDLQFTIPDGASSIMVEYTGASASTTCPTGGTIITSNGIASGSTQGPGNYIVEFTATDNCGNTEICSFNIEVISSLGGCPDNLPNHTYIGEFNGSAYFISDDVARAPDAQAIAQGLGGHLVTINSQAENDFIQPFVSGVMYIGLNDANVENDLEWFDGTPVNYTNFDICDFCTENNDDMDYAIMHSWNGGWSWSNFFNQRQYIVEVPCAVNANGSTQSLIALDNNVFTDEQSKRPTLESVVPNPADNFIFIKINSQTEEEVDLQVYDARGTLVKEVGVSLYNGLVFEELNISDLPSGLYYVKIPQGQKKYSHLKFVKQQR